MANPDKQVLQKLIEVYLTINTNPADEQFHDLARSIGMDPPTLESVAYEMLSKEDATTDALALSTVVALTHLCASFTGDQSDWNNQTAATEAEDVLDGDYSPDTTTPDDLMLNDGEPAGDSENMDNQSALYDDGVGPNDFGVDVDSDQSAVFDDGVPSLKLEAAARLKLTSSWVKE